MRPAGRTVLADARRAVTIATTVTTRVSTAGARSLVARTGLFTGVTAGTVDALERLGPTFVKLGQLVASSPGIFPPGLSEACRRCLDNAPALPAVQIRAAIQADLGRPVDDLFASFDDTPLSAASIAQVHACTLPDGRPAVVKVQRPGIAGTMHTDLRLLRQAALLAARSRRFATANPVAIVDDLRRVTIGELDFALEARRHRQFRDALHTFGDNADVTAPEIYESHSGRRTICMERMTGTPIDRLDPDGVHDGQALLRATMTAWMEAACIHGPFHGDVHAGNIWILDDGRVCFLDFGITGELDDVWKHVIATFLTTVAGYSDWTDLAAAFKAVGAIPDEAGSDAQVGHVLATLIDPIIGQDLGDISFAEVLKTALTLFESLGAVVPPELVLVLKQLLYFERFAKDLAPGWQAATDPALTHNIRARSTRPTNLTLANQSQAASSPPGCDEYADY